MKVYRLLVIASLVVAMCFWTLTIEARSLRLRMAAQQTAKPNPVVINGLKVDLNRYLDKPVALDSTVDRYIVFVSSDACAFSKAQLPLWKELLTEWTPTDHDKLVFISHVGHLIPDELISVVAGRKTKYESHTVVSSLGFARATGVAWTPEILLLDNEMRVRGASAELSPRSINSLTHTLLQMSTR